VIGTVEENDNHEGRHRSVYYATVTSLALPTVKATKHC